MEQIESNPVGQRGPAAPASFAPQATEAALSREEVQALAEMIRDRGLDEGAWEQVLLRRGPDTAACVLLAAIVAGRPPDARLVARVLPVISDDLDDLLPVLAWHCAGDRLGMLLNVIEGDSLMWDRTALCCFLAVEMLAGAAPPPRLLSVLRLQARQMTLGERFLGLAVERITDPAVRKLGARHLPAARTERARKALQALRRRLKATPIEALPERQVRQVGGFTVRRPVERIGRNEPCPCGSGRKYKRCCAVKDEERIADPSPIAGLTMAEYRARIHEFLDVEAFQDLDLAELALMPLEPLPFTYQVAALQQFAILDRWEHAERILELLDAQNATGARGEHTEAIDMHRAQVIQAAILGKNLEVLSRQMPKLKDARRVNPLMLFSMRLMKPTADTLRELEELTAAALRLSPAEGLDSVALVVADHYPALGIALSRAALSAENRDESGRLLQTIEEARDRLGLPPGDRFRAVFDLIMDRHLAQRMREAVHEELTAERERLLGKTYELNEKLSESTARVEEMERRLRLREQALTAQAGAGPGAAAVDQGPPAVPEETEAERRRLQTKVTRLKALIAEGNRERGELRRQLAEAADALSAAPQQAEPDLMQDEEFFEEEEDDGDPQEVRRPVVLPGFSRAFADALSGVPLHVARETLMTVAQLAVGEPAAWRGVKRLQSVVPPLWAARVGIHHRMLFRPGDGVLEILELFHRKQLEAKLKHAYW